ncbi:hypothetical protein Tco_0198179 [Tanacetum coccineum]
MLTEEGRAPDYNNMDPTIDVSSTPTLRIYKIHPQKEPKKVSQALADESWVEAKCKKNFFNSSYKMYGYYVTYQMARE